MPFTLLFTAKPGRGGGSRPPPGEVPTATRNPATPVVVATAASRAGSRHGASSSYPHRHVAASAALCGGTTAPRAPRGLRRETERGVRRHEHTRSSQCPPTPGQQEAESPLRACASGPFPPPAWAGGAGRVERERCRYWRSGRTPLSVRSVRVRRRSGRCAVGVPLL